MTRRPPDPSRWRPGTVAVRGGLERTGFEETAEALFLTQGYVYATPPTPRPRSPARSTTSSTPGTATPPCRMFEERLRLLEGAEACFATATGMAAVFNSLPRLSAGDRVVAARACSARAS